jgi:hypothetical protein
MVAKREMQLLLTPTIAEDTGWTGGQCCIVVVPLQSSVRSTIKTASERNFTISSALIEATLKVSIFYIKAACNV